MADTKLADLTALTAPSGDDLLYVVDDPAGTPSDKKLALDNLFTRGTVTTSSPVIDAAQTWNAGGVTFTGLKFNATDTASAAASLLMDLQVGGTGQFRVTKDGKVYTKVSTGHFQTDSAAGTILDWNSTQFRITTAQMTFHTWATLTSSALNLSTTSHAFSINSDLILTRRAAANLRFGAADAAAPVAQTLSVQSVVAGTTNTAGANFTITGSQGTGTGAGGSIIFQVAPAGSSGTAQNALATALTINSSQQLLIESSGSASAPSLAFATNTGFFSPSGGVVAYTSGGNENFRMEGVLGVGFRSSAFLWWASGTNGAYSNRDLVLARDAANTLALRNGTAAQALRVYNTFTATDNFERANIFWDSNVLKIGTEKGSVGGTARALEFQTDGTTRLTLNASNGDVVVAGSSFWIGGGNVRFVNSGSSDGVFRITGTTSDFGRLQFGGTTSSFPALKRSTTSLQARLADDSAFTNIQGKLTTETAYTAGAPTATGYLVLYDSNGTAYKVPAEAL